MVRSQFALTRTSRYSRALHPVYKRSCLLKLLLNEESCRHIRTTIAHAGGVAAAAGDLVGPIIKTGLIRLPVEKVQIMFTHKELGIVNRIRRRYVLERLKNIQAATGADGRIRPCLRQGIHIAQ